MSSTDPFEAIPVVSFPQWPIWRWAIGGLVAVAVVFATVRMLRPQMDERLYAKYRDLPKAAFLPNDQHPLHPACAAFNLKQYSKALPLFEKDTHTQFALEKAFFEALCLLELNKMSAAEARVYPVTTSTHHLKNEAIWYTALSRLRRHDRKGCVQLLRQLDGATMRTKAETVAFLERYLD